MHIDELTSILKGKSKDPFLISEFQRVDKDCLGKDLLLENSTSSNILSLHSFVTWLHVEGCAQQLM